MGAPIVQNGDYKLTKSHFLCRFLVCFYENIKMGSLMAVFESQFAWSTGKSAARTYFLHFDIP